jgi:flagellar biosynthesis/type III secretory pathway M-ring protein FliF/YscJ
MKTESMYVHWGEKTEIDIQRLTKNRIYFKVKDDNIYIPEDQLKNAVACCT